MSMTMDTLVFLYNRLAVRVHVEAFRVPEFDAQRLLTRAGYARGLIYAQPPWPASAKVRRQRGGRARNLSERTRRRARRGMLRALWWNREGAEDAVAHWISVVAVKLP